MAIIIMAANELVIFIFFVKGRRDVRINVQSCKIKMAKLTEQTIFMTGRYVCYVSYYNELKHGESNEKKGETWRPKKKKSIIRR